MHESFYPPCTHAGKPLCFGCRRKPTPLPSILPLALMVNGR